MNPILPILALATAASLSCTEEKIRTYRVASEETTESAPAPTPPAIPAPEIIGKPKWTAPQTWQKQTPGQFQLELYKITDTASFAVSSLTGDGGGIPANINRWRAQIGLPSSDEPGGQNLEVETPGVTAQLFELKGDQQSILASILTLPKESWFFKLTCATSEIEAMREQFQSFLATIEIATAKNEPPAPAPEKPTDQKSGIGLKVPEGWEKSEGSSMRAASFRIPGNGVPDGDLAVTPLMGQSGSTLENVNRWRGEVSLPPLDSEDDPAIGTKMEGTAGTFLVTHLVSEVPLIEGEKKRATSTAFVKRGDTTWFFILRGEAELVKSNREKFEAFALSAEIP